MALINGNDYDHIDFTKNGVTTRHMLKDTLSRQMSGDLVKVQNEEPTSEGTKIWIKPSGDSEVQVPTYEEFEELRDKLQHLPDAASGNGSYIITQTDGQMVLTPFPAPPSTAGNYVLKATVVNGVATYTWEATT